MSRLLLTASLSIALSLGAAQAQPVDLQKIPSTPKNITVPPTNNTDGLFDIVPTSDGFLVAWTRADITGTHTGLVQQFKPNGVKLKKPVSFAEGFGNGIRPKLVSLNANTVAIIWQSGIKVHGALFNLGENRITKTREIAPADDLIHDAVRLPNGNIAIVTTIADISNISNMREKVSLVIVSPTLATVVAPKSVHGNGFPLDGSNGFDQTIASRKNGGGVVFYRDRVGGQLFGRGFSNGGGLDGAAVRINKTELNLPTALEQAYFEVKSATLTDGNIAVAWTSKEATGADIFEVRARVMSPAGKPLGKKDFLVNGSTVGRQYSPEVVALPNARFLVMWVSDSGITRDIKFRTYGSDGKPEIPVRIAHSENVSVQFLPFNIEAALLGDGSIAGLYDFNGPIGPIRGDGFTNFLP